MLVWISKLKYGKKNCRRKLEQKSNPHRNEGTTYLFPKSVLFFYIIMYIFIISRVLLLPGETTKRVKIVHYMITLINNYHD